MTKNNTTLHMIRMSPAVMADDLQLCINMLLVDDAIVLLDEGCYLSCHAKLNEIINITNNVYMLETHKIARALKKHNNINNISLAQLNDLIFTHDNSVTWQ